METGASTATPITVVLNWQAGVNKMSEDLAHRLIRRIPSRDRSRYLARVLEKSLREDEEALIQSCLAANQDTEAAVEEEFDRLQDGLDEPWTDAPAR